MTDSSVAMHPCGECGMPCHPADYHPYAACLMFKACHNSEAVRANLDAVRGTPAGAGDLENPHVALQKAWAPGHKWEWTKPGEGRWWHHNGEPEWDPDWQYRLAATTPQPTQAQAGAVPVGFRLVPIEPTVEILQAMDRAFSDAMHVGVPVSPEAYDAMIKAVDAADIKGADHG